MSSALQYTPISFTPFETLGSIREVEVFFSSSYDDFEKKNPDTLIAFSFKGARKDIRTDVTGLLNFLVCIFRLAHISADKFPSSFSIDDDNHVIEIVRTGVWTENDYQNLCILLEAVSSIHEWKFRYNESEPVVYGPLFEQAMKS